MASSSFDRKSRGALLAIALPILVLSAWCGWRMVGLTTERERLKEDEAHINSIGNGLLSVDAWKEHLQNIIGERIMHVTFTPQEEATLKTEIEKLLQAVITEADATMRKPQTTLKGKVRKVVYKTVVHVPTLKKHTPEYAQ